MAIPRLLLFADDGLGREFVVIDTKGLSDDELEDEYSEAPIDMTVLQVLPAQLNKWPTDRPMGTMGS